MAYWVSAPPGDVEPYSSDEPPVSDADEVLTVMDDAVERDEHEPTVDATPDANRVSRGERVTWEVSERRFYEVEYALDGIEGNGERPEYLDHDGAIVALIFDVVD